MSTFVFGRSVREVRQPECRDPFQVLRGIRIQALFAVDGESCADRHARPIGVDEPRTSEHGHLRPQDQAETFVGLKRSTGPDEQVLAAIPDVRRLERAAVVPAAIVPVLRDRGRCAELRVKRRLAKRGRRVEIELRRPGSSAYSCSRRRSRHRVLPEVRPDRQDYRHLRHRQRHRSGKCDDDERARIADARLPR